MNGTPENVSLLDQWILEQVADAIIYANRDGRIERWNSAAEKVFGYSFSEAAGQSLDLIIPLHLRSAHWRGFEVAMTTGSTRLDGRATVTRATRKSGESAYVEMSFSVVHDDHGGILGAVAVARDITDRVLREKAAAT